MAIFKCKMCGGTLEINSGETTAICDYCGTIQTLPKLDSERRANLYDRANHFRRNNDYDKAMGIYEQILNEDNTDAEAYWSLVLCRYGIEYVEDPKTHNRIPTCNRTQYTSIYADENYKEAITNADGNQKKIYEAEAEKIDNIQRGILEISKKEEPFDVFICYKESDGQGRRTQDSVLAQDIYYQLKNEGYKVFFSKITLEDKLGTAYEPYIFAALNSAKIMIVVTTKAEYVNAIWVKNEWSRYLQLIDGKNGKTLIPAYKDMDPYDLPEEFSHLQALDMSKLGFMQDLIRGVHKIIKGNETIYKNETIVVNGGNANTVALLKRILLFLEDGEWSSAIEYAEKVLDMDPENGYAYFYELMAECKIHSENEIINQPQPIEGHKLYKKAIRFADNKLKNKLIEYNNQIIDRLAEEERRLKEEEREHLYLNVLRQMERSSTEQEYRTTAEKFKQMLGFKDSDSKVDECLQLAEKARMQAVYDKASVLGCVDDKAKLNQAMELFRTISGYKDSEEKIYECQKKIDVINCKEETEKLEAEEKRLKNELEAKKKATRNKKLVKIAVASIAAISAIIFVTYNLIMPQVHYSQAVTMLKNEDYSSAITTFEALDGYKDSDAKIAECNYGIAKQYEMSGDYANALEYMNKSGNLPSPDEIAIMTIFNSKKGDIVTYGSYEQDGDFSNGSEDIEWQVISIEDGKVMLLAEKNLDCKKYNDTWTNVSWEDSTLRTWLNSYFYNTAFSDTEREAMVAYSVTNDFVYILSATEWKQYEISRAAGNSEYAISQGVYDENGNGWSWLRDEGIGKDHAQEIDCKGNINTFGSFVDCDNEGVRPVIIVGGGN